MDKASLDALVEDTVAPYRGIVPDWALEEMRVLTRVMYASHPVARQLASEQAARPVQQISGVVGDDD